ncbi:TNT domain-containing protein [Micromonospora sp. WMMC241]|uniref:TNT domain-containing protein n=1 Tax=Micromonospora sp. WMMC241 TaxID=3015159 RepID=UPI0022B63D0F|nr:TNT domain-containing protein [Micromonospora sp. WMMC241]MCZ7440461.1 TNT domain-containing protein [Micromonospora sp. WMMC241]
MKTRRWLLAALSGAALTLAPGPALSALGPSAALAQGATVVDERAAGLTPAGPQPGPVSPSLCAPGLPPTAPQTTQFYDNNRLLGPLALPTASPVGPLLAGYQRLGAQTETEWLKNWTSGPTTLLFPPEDGFVLDPHGAPIKSRQVMLPGYRLDRFGNPTGAFLAPLGTPFSARSLAPQSLNTPPTPPATTPLAPLANYHTYCVVKPFPVDSGPIAPWFAQPGMGTQFELNQAYFPQASDPVNVQWLLDHGFLVEEYLDGLCTDPTGWAQSSQIC